jgi:HEPN domain-containing protein
VILIDELKDFIKIDINFRQTLSTINPYYIKSRYPSYKEDLLKNTNQKDAIEFVKIAKEVFSWFEQNKK